MFGRWIVFGRWIGIVLDSVRIVFGRWIGIVFGRWI